MAKDNESEILNDLETTWTDEKGNAGTNKTAEGNVVMRCTNQFLNRSTNGRKQENWACVVLQHETDSASVGSPHKITFGLETREDIKRLNTALVNLGFAPISGGKDKIKEEITRIHREMQGVCFSAKLVPNQKPEFAHNAYINAGARRKDLETVDGSAAPAPSSKF